MKKGDKIRFNGYQGEGTFDYQATTVGKIYEIIKVADPYGNGERAYYKGDDGKAYVWRFMASGQQDDFTLVQAEQIKPKIGDKIRFTGSEFEYTQTTKGKPYEIVKVTERKARYIGDNGSIYAWYYVSYPGDFTLVPAQDVAFPTAAPAEHDLNTLQEGDIIKFMGVPGEDWDCYRDTTIGKEYKIFRVVHDDEGNVARVRYRDDANDAVSWRVNRHDEMYHFKVMTEQQLYKDDVLATAPTLQDLKTTLDMALLLNDIQWAQETYEQIQQMEGEHA